MRSCSFRSRPSRTFASLCLWLLLAASLSGVSQQTGDAAGLTASQKSEIVDAAWQDVRDLFYDPQFRGVDWDRVHQRYLHRIDRVHSREQMETLIRSMVALLHNSHSGVMTHDEIARTHNVLPFFFDKVSGRDFVSYVFQAQTGRPASPIQFGDQILSVDLQPAAKLWLPDTTWLRPVLMNPYFGPAGSLAQVTIRRHGSILTLAVPRVQAFSGVEPVIVSHFGRIAYLRLLKMDDTTVPPQMLRAALDQVAGSDALILDLRHCEGGDAPVSGMLGGLLLGPGVKLVTRVPRLPPPASPEIVERTANFGSIYKGRVFVLVDHGTQSQPEMLAAALQDYGRAKLIGERTRGALNGFTEAVPLPFRAGILEVPVNRSISPHGNEYEGAGVAPDIFLRNSAADFRAGRDAVLQYAVRVAAD